MAEKTKVQCPYQGEGLTVSYDVKNMVCIAHIIGASKLGTVATGNFKY
jgi:hypothetical protein